VVANGAQPDCFHCSRIAEADHRIANHLAMLGSFVRLKMRDLDRRDVALEPLDVGLLLHAISIQISAISHLHRILSADGTAQSADLSVHLSSICAALRTGVSGDVEIIEEFDKDCALPLIQILPVAQIFSEVVTNAIKHGRLPGTKPKLHVTCARLDPKTIRVTIRDNGPGMGINPRTDSVGLGFRLVEGLVAQIGGTIDYSSSPQGVTVSLTLKTG